MVPFHTFVSLEPKKVEINTWENLLAISVKSTFFVNSLSQLEKA